MTKPAAVSRHELLRLVDQRADQVRAFLEWAAPHESAGGWSMRHDKRPDIAESARLAAEFEKRWWGVVVFTCFGRDSGTEDVAPAFRRPVSGEEASAILERLTFRRPAIGHHRIQAGITGAKTALISACDLSEEFHSILHEYGSFEARYERLRGLRAPQWGRTTSFDLLLRTGAIGIGGDRYAPSFAHLAGSTGPSKGFKKIFDIAVTGRNADQCEAILASWTTHWDEVARRVGAQWPGEPYVPADFENTLCIYQEG